jgi:uncharacterized protein (DUF1501 family)
MTNRRSFLATGLSGLSLSILGGTASFAQASATSGKFVFVILRGAMDGLSAVVPYEDRAYRALRGTIALDGPGGPNGTLPLSNGFGLHPSLRGLHELWRGGQLSFMHAASSPYRERSHFDGQDLLESGATRVYGTQTGWLNRAIALLPDGPGKEGIGIGRTVPLVLKGSSKTGSWAPALAEQSDTDTLNRLMDLYAGDALLGPALSMAIETDKIAAGSTMAMTNSPSGGGGRAAISYSPLASAAARILSAPGGPAAAVLSFEGWDTHANQGGAQGQLANRLAQLDGGIVALKTGLGPLWANTTVIVATEFGRTARVNGTGGTDHGTGGAAFMLGGGVKGGRMLGDWPGLSSLYQDRDVTPANSLHSLFTESLTNAWGLEEAAIKARVFNA